MVRTPLDLQRLAWAAGLLPLAVAAIAYGAIPSQPVAFVVPARPALAFDQYLVDLGRVSSSQEERATFLFRNRGSQTAHISSVEPSCGCLSPQVSLRDIEPGDIGRIVLRMQPANESPGRKEFFADVKYTDPQPREVRLTFKLVIPEDSLTVHPRALLVYQNGNRPIHKQIVITDSRAKPAQVLNATSNHPLVLAAVGERQIGERGTIVQAVDVEIGADVSDGRHDALVTIRTDDPETPLVRVPVRIERHPTRTEPNER